MTYDVEVGGRTRRVTLERTDSGLVAAIDGHRYTADVTVINGLWSLILEEHAPDKRSAEPSGRQSYEVAVTEDLPGSGKLTVRVNGRLVSAVSTAFGGSRMRRGSERGSVDASSSTGRQHVTAPMPGKVLKVLVRPGDVVAARQGVVVVEAMKMENELQAPRAGTVAEVSVSEGASVEAGAILVVIQ